MEIGLPLRARARMYAFLRIPNEAAACQPPLGDAGICESDDEPSVAGTSTMSTRSRRRDEAGPAR